MVPVKGNRYLFANIQYAGPGKTILGKKQFTVYLQTFLIVDNTPGGSGYPLSLQNLT